MVGACRLWSQQRTDEIDGLFIDGVEADRCFEPGKQAVKFAKPRQLAVWNRDSVAYPGGSQALALDQDLENGALGLARNCSGAAR